MTISPKSLLLGFIAGALAVLVFHQGIILALHLMKQTPNFPWSMRPIAPFGLPAIINSMFWGGLWGVLYAIIAPRLPGGLTVLGGVVFGLLFPLLLGNGILVPFFKGGPYLFGFVPQRMMIGALIQGVWGLGLGLIYGQLRRRT
jgi:hypothetical protein